MNVKIEGVWCKTRTEFDKLSKKGDYDLSVSYYDIFNRLIKSDPNNVEPSNIIISIYIRKSIQKVLWDLTEKEERDDVKILYMFKSLSADTVNGFRDFINSMVEEDCELDLLVVNRCDFPKTGVLSKFDNVRFIDND
jgi:hypothetical protein|tara:strand:- start:4913 stop:5323 length:411 start_codon:yes stop_codon:yes gene_type:complete